MLRLICLLFGHKYKKLVEGVHEVIDNKYYMYIWRCKRCGGMCIDTETDMLKKHGITSNRSRTNTTAH